MKNNERGGKQAVNFLKGSSKFEMNSCVEFNGMKAKVIGIRLTNTNYYFYDLKVKGNTLFSIPESMIS